jgi:hypothetical protein
MQIVLEIPDAIAKRLQIHWSNLARKLLELLVQAAQQADLVSPSEAEAVLGQELGSDAIASQALKAIASATARIQHQPTVSEPFPWLNVFDVDELQDFIQELLLASTQSTEAIDTVLHEWKESAIAIASPDLNEAFQSEIDEIQLTNPLVVLAQHVQN